MPLLTTAMTVSQSRRIRPAGARTVLGVRCVRTVTIRQPSRSAPQRGKRLPHSAPAAAPPSAGPAPAVALRCATRHDPPGRRRPWCLARGAPPSASRRCALGALDARRRGHHPTGELRRAADPHSLALDFGARRNTIHRLLALRAGRLLLSKSWTDWFECL